MPPIDWNSYCAAHAGQMAALNQRFMAAQSAVNWDNSVAGKAVRGFNEIFNRSAWVRDEIMAGMHPVELANAKKALARDPCLGRERLELKGLRRSS